MSCHVSSSFFINCQKGHICLRQLCSERCKVTERLTHRPTRSPIRLSWTAQKVVVLPTTMLQTVMLPILTNNSQQPVINVLNSIHRHAVASLLSMCHKTSNKTSSAIINIKSVTLSTIISRSHIIQVSTTSVSQ